jgi:hypothetical protein
VELWAAPQEAAVIETRAKFATIPSATLERAAEQVCETFQHYGERCWRLKPDTGTKVTAIDLSDPDTALGGYQEHE